MTTPDPELRRVEPTGNPRVDALIDAMVCPSCRTIYNAAKAKCADLWHHDNRPAAEVSWTDAALAERKVALDDLTMRYSREDLDEAHERGVAEGRRQATEGFEPLRAAVIGVKHLNRPMLDQLRKAAADTSPNWDVTATVYPPSARDLVALVDALLAAVEQVKPTCTCPMIDVTNPRARLDGVAEFVQGLDPGCLACRKPTAEQDGADRG